MTADATIFALSSGQPPAAIAVVRVSGSEAGPALSVLAGHVPPPRRASRARLKSPDGLLLDDALVLWFPGPHSATGEDVAELHLHGGRAVVAAVERALAAMPGLRAAEPGEFTRRAFANGRIDLAEAEGLADLLSAETEAQRRNALALAQGHLSRRVEDWQERLLALAAAVESALDFSDEGDVGDGVTEGVEARIGALCAEIEAWLMEPPVDRLRDGLSVVVAGPPNAGKSTLINALAQREAVIVSDIAGTTRDVVELPLNIGGVAVRLADTAGLRDGTGDIVEAMGIERARAMAEAADILLWLGDPADAPDHPARILIAAQADRHPPRAGSDLALAAKTGQGVATLVQHILAHARDMLPSPASVALNERQRAALDAALTALTSDPGEDDLLIVAERLRSARAALDRVTGRASTDDMLDALFGRFCIGK